MGSVHRLLGGCIAVGVVIVLYLSQLENHAQLWRAVSPANEHVLGGCTSDLLPTPCSGAVIGSCNAHACGGAPINPVCNVWGQAFTLWVKQIHTGCSSEDVGGATCPGTPGNPCEVQQTCIGCIPNGIGAKVCDANPAVGVGNYTDFWPSGTCPSE